MRDTFVLNDYPSLNIDYIKKSGMKKLITLSICLFFFSTVSICQQREKTMLAEDQQSLVGYWNGQIKAGLMSFTFSIKFWIEDGSLRGSLDSPEQDLINIPVDTIIINNDSIKLNINTIQRKYHAAVDRQSNMMAGIYIREGQMNFPLELKKSGSAAVLRRPQMPVKPYPYLEEEVIFINKNDGNELSGTLTIPEGEGVFPAVILISGSGAQDRDESAFGHKPFLVIADYLTRNGISVLRYDDRGAGKSEGNYLMATTEIKSEDVIAAVRYLQSRKELEGTKIGLVGHSEGSIIAALAAGKNPNISYIVLLGAPGLGIEENLYLQNALIRRAEGVNESVIEQYNKIQRNIFSIIKEELNDSIAFEKLREAYTLNRYQLLSDEQKSSIDETIASRLTPYFRDIIKCQPAEYLSKVQCPVLAISGENDLQAPPEQNFPEIERALKSGNNTNYKIIELPGINHMMQTSRKGTITEYSEIEETVSPEVLKSISEWILIQIK